MYLSRVAIDRLDRRKIKDLTHLGAYHNWVESSFPNEFENNIRSRKLWRIDTLQGKKYLLLVSEKEPDMIALEKYGIPGSAQTKCYDKFLDSAFEIADKVEMIHPARFLFNAGSTPKAWNEKMLNDEHFKVLHYEENAAAIFRPTEYCCSFPTIRQQVRVL